MFSWHEKHLDGGTLNLKPSLVGSPTDMQTKRQWSHPCSLDMKNFWMGGPKPLTLCRGVLQEPWKQKDNGPIHVSWHEKLLDGRTLNPKPSVVGFSKSHANRTKKVKKN
jgi:hypothetical protein